MDHADGVRKRMTAPVTEAEARTAVRIMGYDAYNYIVNTVGKPGRCDLHTLPNTNNCTTAVTLSTTPPAFAPPSPHGWRRHRVRHSANAAG
jgi:hypothetical protein